MTGEQDDPDPSQSAERRHGDRRAGADRRKQNWGPPSGVDRRKGERRRGERRTSTAVPEAYARDITNDDYGSWADFRDPVEFDPRAPESPQRVIHLPSGLGPRESLNLNDADDLSRLIVFFLAELEEIRASIARLSERIE